MFGHKDTLAPMVDFGSSLGASTLILTSHTPLRIDTALARGPTIALA